MNSPLSDFGQGQGEPTPYRQVPRNEAAEEALIGALLLENRRLDAVAEFLEPQHFFDPGLGRLYELIRQLVQDEGRVASPVTLKAYAESDPAIKGLGGADALIDLAANVVSVVNAKSYGELIHEAALRRRLIELGETMVNEAYVSDVDHPPSAQIEAAEKQLYELAETGDMNRGFRSLKLAVTVAIEEAEAAFKRDSHITGATVGLRDLDAKLGGLQKSDLIILAGRPSMGKTALATNMAFAAAAAFADSNGEEGAPVGFFSLEMSAEQLATRLMSELTEIPSEKIRKGEVRESDFTKFVEAAQRMAQAPFFIDDTPALSIAQLRSRARRLKRQHGLGLVVVDYLQLLHAGGGRAEQSRVLEISEITRGLKALAKELEIPVLALSQLSRQVENREDKRPQLADLRESGSIEQDADVVMFVFREQYYLERGAPMKRPDEPDDRYNDRYDAWIRRCEEVANIAEAIVAKQRHGPIGTVKLFFNGQYTKFSDLDTFHSE